VLRRSNNLIVFLAPSVDSVRAELVEACHVIDLSHVPVPSEAELAALDHLHDDVLAGSGESDLDTTLVPAPERDVSLPEPQVAPVPQGSPQVGDLTFEVTWQTVLPVLEKQLVLQLLAHPEEHRPAKLPVIAAVGQTVATLGGPDFRQVELSVGEEGEVVASGPGADDLLALWRGDIALDAAAGMLLNELKGGFSEASPPDLDETALRALSKRVAKKLA
jgi:hypothetical protein